MKRVLILDTETTGLDPAVDKVIEVGAILYSIEHATVLESYASLVRHDANAAEAVNRIPAAALKDMWSSHQVWERVLKMSFDAQAFVAHNADFDRSFAPEIVRGVLPWVCSKRDLVWPKQTRPDPSLVPLALEHDLGVGYAHRALADCDLIARLFTRARELGADLEAMLVRGMRPKAKVIALVSYDDRELAKKAGFQWDGSSKQWSRVMPVEDVSSLPFKCRQEAAPTAA